MFSRFQYVSGKRVAIVLAMLIFGGLWGGKNGFLLFLFLAAVLMLALGKPKIEGGSVPTDPFNGSEPITEARRGHPDPTRPDAEDWGAMRENFRQRRVGL